MTPSSLLEDLTRYFKRLGFKVYEDESKNIPGHLKRFDDKNVIWVLLPVETRETIDDEREKVCKNTIARFDFDIDLYKESKTGISCHFDYPNGGSSGTYDYPSIEEYVCSVLRCHHLEVALSNAKVYEEQLSIFDL